MKRLLITTGLLLSIGGNILAEKTKVDIEPDINTPPPKNGTIRPRNISYIPIEVFYDAEIREVLITSENEFEGDIYLYDESENVIAFGNTLDEVISIPNCYSGTVYLYIRCENCSARGKIRI